MPSIRMPSLQAAVLRPSVRVSAARSTRPFAYRTYAQQERWNEPNDGGKHDSPAQDKGPSGKYNLDGTSTAPAKKLWLYGAITVAVVGTYGFMMGRPDVVSKKGIERDTDAMHNQIPSDQQRRGGPIRSA